MTNFELCQVYHYRKKARKKEGFGNGHERDSRELEIYDFGDHKASRLIFYDVIIIKVRFFIQLKSL